MAKRVRTEIDEEAIRRMMSGDVPRLGGTPSTGRTMPTSADKSLESGTASASQEAAATADSENPEKRESQTGQLRDSPDITAKATPPPKQSPGVALLSIVRYLPLCCQTRSVQNLRLLKMRVHLQNQQRRKVTITESGNGQRAEHIRRSICIDALLS